MRDDAGPAEVAAATTYYTHHELPRKTNTAVVTESYLTPNTHSALKRNRHHILYVQYIYNILSHELIATMQFVVTGQAPITVKTEVQQCNTVLYLCWHAYLLIVPVVPYGEKVLFDFSGNAEVHETVRIGLMACINEARTSI